MYTPSFLRLRFPLYLCPFQHHDMRLTSVKCGDERCGEGKAVMLGLGGAGVGARGAWEGVV
jgi:hypothetical protein